MWCCGRVREGVVWEVCCGSKRGYGVGGWERVWCCGRVREGVVLWEGKWVWCCGGKWVLCCGRVSGCGVVGG